MAIRTRSVPDRNRTERTVESVEHLSVADPRLHPHAERIYVDSEDRTSFEFFLGNDKTFTLRAMYHNGARVKTVHADQGWADGRSLSVGSSLTLRFLEPVLDHNTWPIHRIEVSQGRS